MKKRDNERRGKEKTWYKREDNQGKNREDNERRKIVRGKRK